MHLHNLSQENSLLNTFIAELRDVHKQKDALRFRRNIERVGEVLGYELSKTLNYNNNILRTGSGMCPYKNLTDEVVLCSVLRAGLPLHNGLLNYFDSAENAFISAYRHHNPKNPNGFEILVPYVASPSLEGKTLVLADPMLATGQSLVATFEALKSMGTPKNIHLVSVVAAKQGVEYVQAYFQHQTHLWVAAIDPDLDERGYIVPGLGDAGDLSFGPKLQK